MNDFLPQPTHHTLYQALQWVQSTPPLFNQAAGTFCLNQALPVGTEPLIPDTTQLDLLACLLNKKGNPLLGIFYETLWNFLLNQLPDSQVIASNLQVTGEKNGQPATLGEYDMIYQLQNQFIHRELAVKFYLGIPGEDSHGNGSPWRNWVGPGLKDRLDRKMGRLLHHQATLSDADEGQKVLLKLGIEPPVKKEILIQGRLFYPLYPLNTDKPAAIQLTDLFNPIIRSEAAQNIESLCPPPELCNPNHLKGHWLTQNHFLLSTQSITKHFSFQIPHKLQWLNQSPVAGQFNHQELMSQLKQQKQPIYVRLIHQTPQSPLHLFIVPDNWPEKASEKISRTFHQTTGQRLQF